MDPIPGAFVQPADQVRHVLVTSQPTDEEQQLWSVYDDLLVLLSRNRTAAREMVQAITEAAAPFRVASSGPAKSRQVAEA